MGVEGKQTVEAGVSGQLESDRSDQEVEPKTLRNARPGEEGLEVFFRRLLLFLWNLFPQIIEFKLMFQRVAQVVVLWFAWLQL
jgi:hypothetical protein